MLANSGRFPEFHLPGIRPRNLETAICVNEDQMSPSARQDGAILKPVEIVSQGWIHAAINVHSVRLGSARNRAELVLHLLQHSANEIEGFLGIGHWRRFPQSLIENGETLMDVHWIS